MTQQAAIEKPTRRYPFGLYSRFEEVATPAQAMMAEVIFETVETEAKSALLEIERLDSDTAAEMAMAASSAALDEFYRTVIQAARAAKKAAR